MLMDADDWDEKEDEDVRMMTNVHYSDGNPVEASHNICLLLHSCLMNANGC